MNLLQRDVYRSSLRHRPILFLWKIFAGDHVNFENLSINYWEDKKKKNARVKKFEYDEKSFWEGIQLQKMRLLGCFFFLLIINTMLIIITRGLFSLSASEMRSIERHVLEWKKQVVSMKNRINKTTAKLFGATTARFTVYSFSLSNISVC